MQVRIVDEFAALESIADDAGTRILLGIARQIQAEARRSTVKARGPAPRNQPPHEHYGDLDRAIAVGINVDTGEVVVGPRESQIGLRGNVLEFAGTFDPQAGRDARGRFLRGHASRQAPSGAKWSHPFMRPAFESVLASGSFEPAGSVSSSFT
jgi:hypothetical protein